MTRTMTAVLGIFEENAVRAGELALAKAKERYDQAVADYYTKGDGTWEVRARLLDEVNDAKAALDRLA